MAATDLVTAFEEARRKGRTLSLEDAVTYALGP